MAKNPFTALKDYVQKPNRNTFDMRFSNSGTYKFGKLYPVFCKEVIPGDSFKIDTTFGLRFMPMVFPVQTRMQANIHYFYVRNRNLWKDWTDFIGRTKTDLVPPYLSPSVIRQIAKTGELGDYMGLPTTIAGGYGRNFIFSHENILASVNGNFANFDYNTETGDEESHLLGLVLSGIQQKTQQQPYTAGYYGSVSPNIPVDKITSTTRTFVGSDGSKEVTGYFLDCDYVVGSNFLFSGELFYLKLAIFGDDVVKAYSSEVLKPSGTSYAGYRIAYDNLNKVASLEDGYFAQLISVGTDRYKIHITFVLGHESSDVADVNFTSFDWVDNFQLLLSDVLNSSQNIRFGIISDDSSYMNNTAMSYNNLNWHGPLTMTYEIQSNAPYDINEVDNSVNPYASGDLHVSALPFRAYESIYNSFYRNQFNDPFMLNGQKEYNKFITNDEGGEDTTLYELYNRNWEQDFLTSAKQTPVDGDITPLVGVSGNGSFTFRNQDGTEYTVTPQIGDDGHTLTGIQSVEGTPENNSGVRRLMDMVNVGISINDFRNVNSLQRWLETNLRRGYRYKDQLMSHYGVDAKFDVLDMPEFIGGVSQPVNVNQVNQTVDATGNESGLGDFSKVLGSFAGQASVVGQSNNSITKYCDEHGFIIGILSIYPVPTYSQLLPKFFIKDNVLDYYFPEFGHIGNQPITYKEVCPLQSFAAGDPLTDVFGYQRAWYDYLASVDEVHGDFRTSLDGFLINRVFDERPELGKDFVEIDQDDISNPFSVLDDTDKILGQIYFDVTAQRPIPKFGIPRLE